MFKRFFNELIIVLLLLIADVLLLGIVLYEYVPISKTMPNEVAYSTPEDVQEELNKINDIDRDEVIMTYKIDSDDLNNYKKIENYKPGKANPFSSYTESEPEIIQPGEQKPSTSGNTDNTTTGGGTFFQNKGTK